MSSQDHSESNLKKVNVREKHTLPKISKPSHLLILVSPYKYQGLEILIPKPCRQRGRNFHEVCSWQGICHFKIKKHHGSAVTDLPMDISSYHFVNCVGLRAPCFGLTPLFCCFLLHEKFKKRVKNLLDEGDVV